MNGSHQLSKVMKKNKVSTKEAKEIKKAKLVEILMNSLEHVS